ncbi:MAG TPA: hypothetical protein VGL86_08680 [Polyangia bacterium]|jgi:hypothetical protein
MIRTRSLTLAIAFAIGLAGCATPLGSDGNWTQLASDHFRVLTDADAAAIARELPRVETALAGIAARVRPDRALPARIDVLWLRRADAIAALGVGNARGYYLPHQGDEPSAPPLVVVGGAPGRAVEKALMHELAHVVFVDAAPGAPAWLAEGMAAWWDTLDVDRATVGFDEQAEGQWMIHMSMTPSGHFDSVGELLHASYHFFHEFALSEVFYAKARALVEMLGSEPDLAPRFDAYLARLRSDADAERAWNDSFAGIGMGELEARFATFYTTRRQPLPLSPWRGRVASAREPRPAVERWLGRARPWDSPAALAEAGRAFARAAGDDSAERHYWSGVYAAAQSRWRDAETELRAALARDPKSPAASALARVEARLRANR